MKQRFSSDIIQVCSLAGIAVLILSAILYFGPGRQKLEDQASEKRFWTFKVQAAKAYQAVLIGDSRAYRGFDPEIFEADTGLATINLGFSSAGFSRSLFELAERHLKPSAFRLIILAVTPFSLTEEAAKNEHLSQWVSRSQSELLSHRYLEKALIYLSPSALKALSNRPERNPYVQTFFDSGFVHSNRPVKEIEAGLETYKVQFNKEKVSSRRMDELLQQISAWKKDGITVLAYRPPVDPRLKKLEDDESGWDGSEWAKRLRELSVPWLEFSDEQYETYDGSHLTGESAREFTREIAQKVKGFL